MAFVEKNEVKGYHNGLYIVLFRPRVSMVKFSNTLSTLTVSCTYVSTRIPRVLLPPLDLVSEHRLFRQVRSDSTRQGISWDILFRDVEVYLKIFVRTSNGVIGIPLPAAIPNALAAG